MHDHIRRLIGHDPLQRIWGIGPRTARHLRQHKVDTFEQLAAIDITQLDLILNKSGLDYRLPRPTLHTIWTEQARLASAGVWIEFEAMAGALRAEYPDKVEDLQQIWGIDPRIRDRLHESGITQFDQLAAATPERLEACVIDLDPELPSSSHELYTIWIEQARLAADGDWDELEAVQAQLDHG